LVGEKNNMTAMNLIDKMKQANTDFFHFIQVDKKRDGETDDSLNARKDKADKIL